MTQNQPKAPYATLRDHFNTAALGAAVYVPYLAIKSMSMTPDSLATHCAVIAGVFTALRFRYLREIPMFIGNKIIMGLIARGQSCAPENIQSMTDEFTKKAGRGPIKAYVYERGITENAMTVGDRIYIGRGLVDGLTEKEMRFVVAHEVSHSKTQDMSESYLFWPPYCAGLLMFAFVGLSAPLTAPSIGVGMGLLGLTWMNHAYTRFMRAQHSQRNEYRADTNALRLTEDLESAQSALKTLNFITTGQATPEILEKFKAIKENFPNAEIIVDEITPKEETKSDTFFDWWRESKKSHPPIAKRVENLAQKAQEFNIRPPAAS